MKFQPVRPFPDRAGEDYLLTGKQLFEQPWLVEPHGCHGLAGRIGNLGTQYVQAPAAADFIAAADGTRNGRTLKPAQPSVGGQLTAVLMAARIMMKQVTVSAQADFSQLAGCLLAQVRLA